PTHTPSRRPDVFRHSSAATFLKEWISYRRGKAGTLSARGIARALGYSTGYLALVLNRKRALPMELLEKMLPHLGLAEHEARHLRNLREKDAQNTLAGDQAFARQAQRSRRYQHLNPLEYQTYRYMSQWLCVVIREMARLLPAPRTIEDIQATLLFHARREEIRPALEFLVRNRFLKKNPTGDLQLPNENLIECRGDIYRLALARYHQSMLNRAIDAIEVTPREDRLLEGLTVALSEPEYQAACAILNSAINQVMSLAQSTSNKQSVYHLGVLAYPLTKKTAS
ncbi:MAG: TIGR02147 family protein, partial [Bacteriovoracia bacterium]